MDKDKAFQIPIDVWQDPQGDIVLNTSGRECVVFFGCWDKQGDPTNYLSKISFKNCWASRFTHSQYLPYKIYGDKAHSYILKIENSTWLRCLINEKREVYPDGVQIGLSWDKKEYIHFVVHGHDAYIDIIATDFIMEIIPRECAGELVRLIDEA